MWALGGTQSKLLVSSINVEHHMQVTGLIEAPPEAQKLRRRDRLDLILLLRKETHRPATQTSTLTYSGHMSKSSQGGAQYSTGDAGAAGATVL